jgi:hypothetical protein
MKDILEALRGDSDIGESMAAQAGRVAAFEERYDAVLELLTNKSLPRYERSYRMQRAFTEAENPSDFPILMGTVIDRQLLAKYQAATPDWRSYVKVGTQRDFRPQNLIGIYSLQGQLQQVALRGPYQADEVLGEGKVQIQIQKYGAIFPFGWETMVNDDLGAFSDIAERLALRALRTEYLQATSLFVSAAGPHASLFGAPIAHPIDGKNVTNSFTGASATFNITNLGQAASIMRRFVDADGEPVIFDGFDLVVPPALEIAMLQALNPANIIQSGGDSTAGAKAIIRSSSNTVPQLNITGHVNPYLPIIDKSGNADKTWYLFGRMGMQYAVRLNFLAGHESPEVVMKSPNKVTLGGGLSNPTDGDFESDSMQWRVRHILGGTQVDPRYAIANVGA